MKETETITLFTKEQYTLFVTICFFSSKFLKNKTKGNKCKMWKSQRGTWDFQNSEPGSQDFLFQKVSASTGPD